MTFGALLLQVFLTFIVVLISILITYYTKKFYFAPLIVIVLYVIISLLLREFELLEGLLFLGISLLVSGLSRYVNTEQR